MRNRTNLQELSESGVESMNKDDRISDVLQEKRWEDILTFLDSRHQEILGFMQKVKAQRERSDENILYFQCLAKACELMELFANAWGANLPLGCVATRCMLELDILVRLFEAEPTLRMKFYYSVIWEEKELWQAFLSAETSDTAGEPIRQHIKHLIDMERRHKLSQDRQNIGRLNWHKLAQRFNVKQDYDTIYRWSSKFLHITPFSVLRIGTVFSVQSEREAAWKMLLVMIQLYLGDIYSRLAVLLKLETGT